MHRRPSQANSSKLQCWFTSTTLKKCWIISEVKLKDDVSLLLNFFSSHIKHLKLLHYTHSKCFLTSLKTLAWICEKLSFYMEWKCFYVRCTENNLQHCSSSSPLGHCRWPSHLYRSWMQNPLLQRYSSLRQFESETCPKAVPKHRSNTKILIIFRIESFDYSNI